VSRILSGASTVRRAVVVLLALGASIVSSASQPSRDPAAIELRVGFARPGAATPS